VYRRATYDFSISFSSGGRIVYVLRVGAADAAMSSAFEQTWCAILLLLSGFGAAGPGGSEDIVSAILDRVDERSATLHDAVYLGEYRYEERDAGGTLLRTEECRRRVYTRAGRQRVEFLSVRVNGTELTGRGRERQIAALRRKGLVQDEAVMPFFSGAREAYDYQLLGTESRAGQEVWVVGFTPRRRSMQTVVGHALVATQTRDLVEMQFRPSLLPWVCVGTEMRLFFSPRDGHAFPERFEMDMEIRVRLIVTLMRRRLRIDDRFSDYRFNTGFPDSVFEQ